MGFVPFFDLGETYEIYDDKLSIESIVIAFSQDVSDGKISTIKKSLRKLYSSYRFYSGYLNMSNPFDYFIPNVLARVKDLHSLIRLK